MRQLLIPALLVLLFPGFSFSSFAQKKLNLSAGFSFPEGYNLGSRFEYKTNKRIDFFYGFSQPFEKETNWNSFSLNHASYFGKVRQKTRHKPWTINTGFTYAKTNLPDYRADNGFINLYFAREISITKNVFIEPKLGCSYLLFYNIYEGMINGYVIRFIPNFGLNLGFRI